MLHLPQTFTRPSLSGIRLPGIELPMRRGIYDVLSRFTHPIAMQHDHGAMIMTWNRIMLLPAVAVGNLAYQNSITFSIT